MTGLMVFQGLSTSNMKRLQLEHLKLYQGKVYIPRGKIGNRRELALQPWQVMELMEYVNEVHPQILKRRKMDPPNGKASSEYLFIVSENRLTDTVMWITKKINHKVENIYQIRASVIVYWLSKYNLRKVQIMAGHKYMGTPKNMYKRI